MRSIECENLGQVVSPTDANMRTRFNECSMLETKIIDNNLKNFHQRITKNEALECNMLRLTVVFFNSTKI